MAKDRTDQQIEKTIEKMKEEYPDLFKESNKYAVEIGWYKSEGKYALTLEFLEISEKRLDELCSQFNVIVKKD